MTTCAQGAMAAFYVEPGAAPHTFDGGSERYEILYESLGKRQGIAYSEGIRGTRSQASERTRFTPYLIRGNVAMNVTPGDLVNWLPRILGGTPSGTTFALSDSLANYPFGVLVDRVTQTFEYKDCYINRAVFRGVAGQGNSRPPLIEMILDIVGKDIATGTSAPAVSLPTTATVYAPYVFSDGTVTLAGASRNIKEFALVIDNMIQPRWVNSLTPGTLCPSDRKVMLRVRCPYDDDHDDLYAQGVTGATGSLTLTNGNVSTSFSFGTLQVPPQDPNVLGKTEIDIVLDMVARKTGSTAELTVTNDSTP